MLFSKPTIRLLKTKCFKWNHRTLSAQNLNEKKSLKIRAWQMHSYGDLKEVQLTAARYPFITNPNDVLIQVQAASVNPIDLLMLGGYGKNVLNFMRQCDLEFPLTLGRDFSGIVLDKGHSVGDDFKIGDEVYGVVPLHKQGSHTEIFVSDKLHIIHKPSDLNYLEAASILYTSMTAWASLFLTGELLVKNPARAQVLILGASGGVGTVATQILKSQHTTVIGTCSSNAIPLVQSLGADNIYDYTDPNYITNVAAEGKFDIILDCAKFGYQNLPNTWQYDKFITLNSPLLLNTDKYGLIGGSIASLVDLINANVGKLPVKSVRYGYFVPSQYGLEFIDNLIRTKKLIPTIHRVFNFEDLPKAYETLSQGHARGKFVIDMNSSFKVIAQNALKFGVGVTAVHRIEAMLEDRNGKK